MKDVLFEYLNEFVVVRLDDIAIYSRTLNEPVKHLSIILSRLRDYKH